MEDLWERALQDLKGRLSSDNFDTWLAPLSVERADAATLTLRVPNKFYADWLQTHYVDLVLEALRALGAPHSLRIEFSVSEATRPRLNVRPSELPPRPVLPAMPAALPATPGALGAPSGSS